MCIVYILKNKGSSIEEQTSGAKYSNLKQFISQLEFNLPSKQLKIHVATGTL